MIYNQAATSLDANAQNIIFERIKEEMKDGGLIWVDDHGDFESKFDRVLHVERGRVAEPLKGEAPERPSETAGAQEDSPAAAGSELDEEANLLAGVPFFAEMDRSRLKLLAFTADRQQFKEGQYLFMQGSVAEVAYVILNGSVDVVVDTSKGGKVVATLDEGQLVGELALLCEAPRTASIRAKSPLTVLSISKDIFIKHIREDREMSANLTRIIADRLADMLKNVFVGQGLYDELTGLPNRELLKDRMKYLASMEKRSGSVSALVMIRMDEITEMENSGGPLNKDVKAKLLKDVSLKLKRCLREADTLAYLEGFGFGVIANAPSDTAAVDTDTVTKRISKAISEPFIVGDKKIHLKKGLDFKVYPLNEENLRVVGEIL
ncbi:MAG TPA: cyclic nucleotide-binding domain-containing protein [Rhodospirillales bacterium]|nr:cyclic nucleotide-binding domain-containing protein [Rhodospirillales bacterium]